jgi:hypothetical protein
VPGDELAGGGDQPRRVVVERAEGVGGLRRQVDRIGPTGAGDVAEVLDRVQLRLRA